MCRHLYYYIVKPILHPGVIVCSCTHVRSFRHRPFHSPQIKGMTGKRTGYTSVPYTSVGAFSVETVGGMLDTDSKLTMHARGIGRLSMDYAMGVDVLSIFRFLSTAVIRGKAAGEHAAAGAIVHDPGAAQQQSSAGGWGGSTAAAAAGGFLDIFGSNYSQIDKCAVESRLKCNPNILLHDEKVEMAFKCGRDSFVLTSHRVLRIDVQGLSGKKGEEGFVSKPGRDHPFPTLAHPG